MSQTRKIFTLDQANRTLPYVRRVVRDIVESHQRISELYTRLRGGAASSDVEHDAEELKRELRVHLERRDEFMQELETIGCEFKDTQRGLVDFPALLDDRLVYLCWRLDEPEVLFWHEMSAGFAGRRSVEGFFSCDPADAACTGSSTEAGDER